MNKPFIIHNKYFSNNYNRYFTNSNTAVKRNKTIRNISSTLYTKQNSRENNNNFIAKLIEDGKSISSKTGSGSKIYLLDINEDKIIMKLNPSTREIAEHEYIMYGFFNMFIKYQVTPYVIQRIPYKPTTYTVNNTSYFVMLLQTYEPYKLNSLLNFMNIYMKNPEKNNKYVEVMLFQILYTLACMNKIGMRHNDLHSSNILVVDNRKNDHYKNKYRQIKLNNSIFYIPLQCADIRIFDLDRGIKGNLESRVNNKTLLPAFFKKYVIDKHILQERLPILQYADAKYNPHVDCYKILMHLKDKCSRFKSVRDITSHIPNKQSMFTNKMHSVLFKKFHLLFNKGNKTINPDYLRTPLQLLKHDMFNKYKILPQNGTIVETYDLNNIYMRV